MKGSSRTILFGPAGDRHEGIRPMLDGRAGYSLSVTTNGPLELASKLSGFLKRKKQTYGNYGPEEPRNTLSSQRLPFLQPSHRTK